MNYDQLNSQQKFDIKLNISIMPDLFDGLVIGCLGLVGLGSYFVYKDSDKKIKELRSLPVFTHQELQEMRKRGADEPKKGILHNARVQPYNNRQMQLVFTGVSTDPKKPYQPLEFQTFSEYSSRDFARLTFPKQMLYPSKFRLQVKKTSIQNSLVTKQSSFFKGTSYSFSRLLTMTIVGAIGYDYQNEEFFVSSFSIAKSLNQLLDSHQLTKTICVGVAIVGVVLAGGVLIAKNFLMNQNRNQEQRQRQQ